MLSLSADTSEPLYCWIDTLGLAHGPYRSWIEGNTARVLARGGGNVVRCDANCNPLDIDVEDEPEAPVAIVAPEIADAFGMRNLPNVVVPPVGPLPEPPPLHAPPPIAPLAPRTVARVQRRPRANGGTVERTVAAATASPVATERVPASTLTCAASASRSERPR